VRSETEEGRQKNMTVKKKKKYGKQKTEDDLTPTK